MSTVDLPRSMNESSERDPHNNNCYGTTVDRPYVGVSLPVLDVHDFNDRIIRGYEDGTGEEELPADLSVARSLIPAGTAFNPSEPHPALIWILFHVLQEYARHTGHLEVARELADGTVGE